jgi:DNA-binding CsgD family transcriptional regulator
MVGTGAVQGLAAGLRDACGILPIARAAFSALADISPFASHALALHAPDGRPLLTVDNAGARRDDDREAYLSDGWTSDSLLRSVVDTHAPQASERELLMPLLEPGGLIGTLRCHLSDACSREDERRLAAVGMVVAGRLLQLGVTAATLASDDLLTRRQRATADLALQGLTTDQIAAALAISRNTVKKHLHEVFDRLAVSNRVQLARALQITQATSDVPLGITRSGDLVVARRPVSSDAFGGTRRNGARGSSSPVQTGAAG